MTYNPDSKEGILVNDPPAIYAALDVIKRELTAIGKSSSYTIKGKTIWFRGIDAVQIALSPLLADNHVVTACADRRVEAIAGSCALVATYRFTSLVDGSYVDTVSSAFAQTRDDKGLSSAGSTAYKYAIFELFCVPTADQADNDQAEPTYQPPPAASQPPAAAPSGDNDQQLALAEARAAVRPLIKGLSPAEVRGILMANYEADASGMQTLSASELRAGTAKIRAGQ